jgi:uncharacterized membrane protein (DUF106 family)
MKTLLSFLPGVWLVCLIDTNSASESWSSRMEGRFLPILSIYFIIIIIIIIVIIITYVSHIADYEFSVGTGLEIYCRGL